MHRLSAAAALIAALALGSALHAQPGEAVRADETRANVLRIVVNNVTSADGHVRVDVCSRSEFLSKCRYGGSAPATRGVTTVEVRDLPPGVYAVQAYDDQNDNRRVDRNVLGLPKEAVGFSNDAPVGVHGPSFKNAAFTYSGGEQTISLRIRRYFP